jgi:hypothetical protein
VSIPLKHGNGIHPVLEGARTLREIDLLPNLDYMEMLLQVFDREVPNGDGLLAHLALARCYRDPVGQAALALDIVPGGDMWQYEVEAPQVPEDDAMRVARTFTGRAPVS